MTTCFTLLKTSISDPSPSVRLSVSENLSLVINYVDLSRPATTMDSIEGDGIRQSSDDQTSIADFVLFNFSITLVGAEPHYPTAPRSQRGRPTNIG